MQWCNQAGNPIGRKPRVGVTEDKDLRIPGLVCDAMNEVVHLLAATFCQTRNRNRSAGLFQDSDGCVLVRLHDEDDSEQIPGVVLLQNGPNVFSKSGIESLAGAEDDNRRRCRAVGTVSLDMPDGAKTFNQREHALQQSEAADPVQSRKKNVHLRHIVPRKR